MINIDGLAAERARREAEADGHPGDDEVARLCCPAVPQNVIDELRRRIREARQEGRAHEAAGITLGRAYNDGKYAALVLFARDVLGIPEEAPAGNNHVEAAEG